MQLELEAVERRIQELLGKQAQLRKRKATLETSRADAHKSGVSMQRAANTPTTSTPCVSLHRPRAPGTRSSQMAFTPAPGNHGPWVQQRKTRSRPRATTSPPPVFDISSRNRFAPLCETDRDAVVIGDSIVRHVRATLAEGKMHTHCLPGARVLDVSVQIPAILKDDESVAAVVIHAGANDTKLRQTETLKRDFRSLIETVRSTSPAATIIMSGPLPTYRRGHEKFSRLFALNEPLLNIINSSLSLGHVPKPFKLAVIKPLIKKPKLDPCELANYRPISNLPFMSKILEKVVSAQLCSFLPKK